MRSRITLAALAALMVLSISSVALADAPQEVFEAKPGWLCEGDGFVEGHCLNTNSKGKTWNIKVFEADRGPQESASLDPRADTRPCPKDPSSPDGTWWEFAPGLWVCHH